VIAGEDECCCRHCGVTSSIAVSLYDRFSGKWGGDEKLRNGVRDSFELPEEDSLNC
jgi:hypothetical protein